MLNRKLYILFWTLVTLLIMTACNKFGRLQKHGTPDEKLKAAIEYYNKKDYYKAGVLLDDVVPLLKGRQGAEDAMYYHAYNYFAQKQYMMSAYYFKDFYLTFPRSLRLEEMMYMHIKSLYFDSPHYNLDQSSTYECLKAMDVFLQRYPNTQYKEDCNMILQDLTLKLAQKSFEGASLYHKVGNYKAAVVSLNNFIDNYGNSMYAERAYYLRIESQYLLAKHSVHGKVQIERYQDVIPYFQTFVDRFPSSDFRKKSEEYYDLTIEALEQLKK
jgi:outer membrane protein assembly factor BamD